MTFRRLWVFGLSLFMMAELSGCTVIDPPKPILPSRAGIVAGQQISVDGSQNIYAVARKYNVSMRDLIVLNDIQPPYLVHQGQKLILPAPPGAAPGEPVDIGAMPPPAASPAPDVEMRPLLPVDQRPLAPLPPLEKPYHSQTNANPGMDAIAAPAPRRAIASTATPPPELQQAALVSPPPPAHSAKTDDAPVNFVWPLQGTVLSSYGTKGQGLSNDGVNIGAPKGAPVVAAANGIVVYAGNDMKGFGNLILIRHQGGWVTAYAHLDRSLVSKDAVVAQGDMIGTVGKTGDVSTPQLHFEVRRQGKAVDPNGIIKG